MKAKKRYVIAFWIAASLVLVMGVAMVAVLSAFNATAQSGFEISYTAGANVKATISAKYKVGSGTEKTVTADGANQIVFDTSDTLESVTKSFDKVTGVSMGKDDEVLITYTIKNDDTVNAVKLVASADTTSSNNLKFEYSIDNTNWKTAINDNAVVPAAGLTIAKSATQNVYVKITVVTKTQSASFDGSFDFNLIAL